MFSDTCTDQLVVFNYSQFNIQCSAAIFTARTLVKIETDFYCFCCQCGGVMLNSNVLLVQVHKYGQKQVSCTVLWVLWCTCRCDYTWFFWRTTKNPVAYVTSQSLILSPELPDTIKMNLTLTLVSMFQLVFKLGILLNE